jgi:hypothetical protein
VARLTGLTRTEECCSLTRLCAYAMRVFSLLVCVCQTRSVSGLIVSGVAPTHPTPMATQRVPLLTSTPEVLRSHFGWPQLAHAASDKANAIWGLLRKGIDPRAEAEEHLWNPNLYSPKLRRLLEEECMPVCAGEMSDCSISSDGTQKLLLRLEDGLAVEFVIIPMLGGKTTSLCISSQVGCSRGCTFCSRPPALVYSFIV